MLQGQVREGVVVKVEMHIEKEETKWFAEVLLGDCYKSKVQWQ